MFKFVNAKYVQSLLENGTVKIGTAAGFRIPDGKDGGRSDADELITKWRPGPTTVQIDRHHALAKAIGADMPEGKTIKLVFEEGAQFNMAANAYMFCGSSEITPNLRARMVKDFDADACVRINDLNKFAELLCEHPLLRGKKCAFGRVTFQSSDTVTNFTGHDYFKKHHRFGWQKEIRIVWLGGDIPLEGEIIQVPEVISLLERIF